MEETKYSYNENPVCPHCDAIYDVQYNESYFLYNEEYHDIECNDCGKQFFIETRVKYKFSTSKMEETTSNGI